MVFIVLDTDMTDLSPVDEGEQQKPAQPVTREGAYLKATLTPAWASSMFDGYDMVYVHQDSRMTWVFQFDVGTGLEG